MIGSLTLSGPGSPGPTTEQANLTCAALIEVSPEHPGGYALRGSFRMRQSDFRDALADLRKAKSLGRPEQAPLNTRSQLPRLEQMARWEQKLPAVLRGEVRPANGAEFAELAGYCAGFERRFVLAARFAGEALAADPKLYASPTQVCEFAGWSVRAGVGDGVDAASLTPEERAALRRRALAWLREGALRLPQQMAGTYSFLLRDTPDLRAVRDTTELAKLPPRERAAWGRFWADVRAGLPKPKPEMLPPPDVEK